MNWYLHLGLRPDHLRLRPHDADELSHYSSGTSDVEYLFPIGRSPDHRRCGRCRPAQTRSLPPPALMRSTPEPVAIVSRLCVPASRSARALPRIVTATPSQRPGGAPTAAVAITNETFREALGPPECA